MLLVSDDRVPGVFPAYCPSGIPSTPEPRMDKRWDSIVRFRWDICLVLPEQAQIECQVLSPSRRGMARCCRSLRIALYGLKPLYATLSTVTPYSMFFRRASSYELIESQLQATLLDTAKDFLTAVREAIHFYNHSRHFLFH
jgi:hypothetical protein